MISHFHLKHTSGAAGSRTLVQTHPSQAFYMFIQLLVFEMQQEPDQPTAFLEE